MLRIVFYSLSTILIGGLVSLFALRADFASEKPIYKSLLSDYSRGLDSIGRVIHRHAANYFQVRDLEIRGSYNFSEVELRGIIAVKLPLWVWQIEGSSISSKLEQSPLIRSAIVNKTYFPAKATVTVQEIEPWLVANLQGEQWLVSREGHLVQPLSQIKKGKFVITASKLPRIVGDISDNKRFRYSLQLLKLVQVAGGFPFEYERVELLPNGGIAVYPALGERTPVSRVLLDAESFNQAELLIERLRRVLKDLELRGESVREVDLRFADQAVVK